MHIAFGCRSRSLRPNCVTLHAALSAASCAAPSAELPRLARQLARAAEGLLEAQKGPLRRHVAAIWLRFCPEL